MSIQVLPQLDGTLGATRARLEAWTSSATDDVEATLYGVRAHLEEALCAVPALASAEECSDELCTKAGDVEYLGDELSKARERLHELTALLENRGQRP